MPAHQAWKPGLIKQAGLYTDIPIERYHTADVCDGPSISSSGLREIFNKSPAHYWVKSPLNPEAIEEPDKREFILGRAVHHLLLGEPDFAQKFSIQPVEYPDAKTGELKPWNNNATYCKQWHAGMKVQNRSVLTPKEVEQIKGMAIALGTHPIVRSGALNGKIEVSGFTKDKETGIWLKIRPDAIPRDSGDYVDLKTTISVQWPDLMRAIYERGYHMQLALIRHVVTQCGFPFNSATLVFVEKTPPFSPRVVTIRPADLDLGDKQNKAALKTFTECLKAKHWPGPGGDCQDAEYIELGDYARSQIDAKLTAMGATNG